jgi:hypothetical protein
LVLVVLSLLEQWKDHILALLLVCILPPHLVFHLSWQLVVHLAKVQHHRGHLVMLPTTHCLVAKMVAQAVAVATAVVVADSVELAQP